jgi:hypothetical protein
MGVLSIVEFTVQHLFPSPHTPAIGQAPAASGPLRGHINDSYHTYLQNSDQSHMLSQACPILLSKVDLEALALQTKENMDDE